MLAFVVFINGMCIMVLEMAGARLMAPVFGTSVVVWTSLIGVILGSLSVGYWLGGRLGDKCLNESGEPRAAPNPKQKIRLLESQQQALEKAKKTLALLLTLASASVLVAVGLSFYLPDFFATHIPSFHIGSVLAAISLFVLPSLLCGMISSFAIRMGITDKNSSGQTIGKLYALSTIGSILGTFLGGFLLIAWLGTIAILFAVAACLLICALAVKAKPLLPKFMILLIILGATSAHIQYSAWVLERGFPEQGVPIRFDTAYSSARISASAFDGIDSIFLMTDHITCQSGMSKSDPAGLLFKYTRFYSMGPLFNPEATRVLVLGGGGYSLPKWLLAGRSPLHGSEFELDVVELDPVLTAIAGTYFQTPLDDPRLTVYHEDARTFLNRKSADANGTYGIILADLFNTRYTVPFQVTTREAAEHIYALLDQDGVFVMNVISALDGEQGQMLHAVRNALLESFEQVYIFPVDLPEDNTSVQNIILLAFKTEQSLPATSEFTSEPEYAKMLSQQWQNGFSESILNTPALSDDYAPVERYAMDYVQLAM